MVVYTKVDGLLQCRFSKQAGGVADTTASWDELTATTVDGVPMHLQRGSKKDTKLVAYTTYKDIEEVEPDTPHILFGADTLLSCPLEGSNAGILDLVKVLHTFGNVNE